MVYLIRFIQFFYHGVYVCTYDDTENQGKITLAVNAKGFYLLLYYFIIYQFMVKDTGPFGHDWKQMCWSGKNS